MKLKAVAIAEANECQRSVMSAVLAFFARSKALGERHQERWNHIHHLLCLVALRVVVINVGVPSPSVSAQLADKGACVLCKRLAAPSDVELKKNMIIMKLQRIYTQKSSRVAFVKGKMLIPTIAYYHFNIKNNHLVVFNFIWWHFCWKVELFFLSSAERN